jgi:hypothetical protein
MDAASTSSDTGRSEGLSLLIIDEAAHIDGLDELWAAIHPTLSTGGSCIALSTPYGVGNFFHKLYINAEARLNDFYPTCLPWHVHPERDQEWFEHETRNMTVRDVAQELLCNFNASGETVIHSTDVDWMRTLIREPKYKTGYDRNYHIWKEMDPTNSYLLVADVARGDGADFSVFMVIEPQNMEVVAEYQGKPNIDLFAEMIYTAGKEYGNAMVVVENNNIGFSVLEKLINKEYSNLYYSIKSSNEFIDPIQAETVSNSVPGFTTSLKTRPLIIAKLEEFVRNKLLKSGSQRFIREIETFVWNNGRPEAQRGYNDDLIMAAAIACWVRDTVIVTNQRELEYSKAMLGSMLKTNTKINTNIPGMLGYSKKEQILNRTLETKKQYEQFLWVYKG